MGMVLELSPNNHCLDVETAVNLYKMNEFQKFLSLQTCLDRYPVPFPFQHSILKIKEMLTRKQIKKQEKHTPQDHVCVWLKVA